MKDSLFSLLEEKFYLHVPYKHKDDVKRKGAKWDSDMKKWYVKNTSNKKDELIEYYTYVNFDEKGNYLLDENKKPIDKEAKTKYKNRIKEEKAYYKNIKTLAIEYYGVEFKNSDQYNNKNQLEIFFDMYKKYIDDEEKMKNI